MQQGYRQQSGRQSSAQSQQSQALVLSGSWTDPRDVSAQLAQANEHAHLVAPATSVAVLPEGCSVVLSTVMIDVDNETYDVSGKRGLSKTALDRIAAAAGVSWDPRMSGRIDDGSDPYYCAWHAVGTVRHLDGTEVTIEGSKEMDLRDGSPQLEGLFERYEAARRNTSRKYPAKDPTAQIREMRLHIMAHAESKARLRAIRSIGVRSSYSAEELGKPFVVARLMFTGQSSDPAIRSEFARMTALSFLGGRRALYGGGDGGHAPIVSNTPRMIQSRGTPPPPVGAIGAGDDEEPDIAPAYLPAPAPAHAQNREPIRGQQTPARPQPAREDAQTGGQRQASGVAIPGGNAKGTPIEEASDRDLEYWEQRISKALEDGSSRYPDKDQTTVEAMRREISFRSEGSR